VIISLLGLGDEARREVKNPFLVGTKVYLRPLEREDAPVLVPWFNDPEVTRTLRRYLPLALREEQDFIEKLGQNEHNLAVGIALRDSDRLIGGTGFHDMDFRNRHASFGILIGEKMEWGKGYGTEATALMVGYAFETLNLNRVWLHVYEHNPKAMRAYEKVGFRREGVLRQDCYREGRYWDTIVMAILREEWAALQSKT
jgi:RimJ/RimL family protein N-acetyltransferase